MKQYRVGIVTTAIVAGVLLAQSVSAQLLESWEGSLDGWTVPQGASYFTYAPATKFGVTDGTYSAALIGAPSSQPNYGQMLLSPYEASWTAILGSSTSLSLDVYGPAGSFGGYLQFDVDVNNADIGYQSIDGYSYPGISPDGNEHTITIAIPASIAAGLAASSNPTQIAIQVGGGFTSGNETMYLDNLRVIPEPSAFALLGFGVLGLVGVARRRRS